MSQNRFVMFFGMDWGHFRYYPNYLPFAFSNITKDVLNTILNITSVSSSIGIYTIHFLFPKCSQNSQNPNIFGIYCKKK